MSSDICPGCAGCVPPESVKRFKRTAIIKGYPGRALWSFTSLQPLTDAKIMQKLTDLGFALSRSNVTIVNTPDELEIL